MSDENELGTIVDFSEDIASSEAPPLLPVRDYPATIVEASIQKSSKDNKYAAVTFLISPEDFPADYDPSNAPEGKRLVYRRLVLEDNVNARYRLRKFCEAIGAPMSKQIDVSTWVGMTAKVALKHSNYEGEDREEIGKISAG